MKNRYDKSSGFTIIELMIAVAIAGVMAAIAIPGFSTLIKNNCMTTTANSLVTSLQLAKSEAVKRRATVTLAPTKSSSDADYASNEWGEGWQIFIDTNNNGSVSAGEEIIRDVSLTCGVGKTTVDGDDTSVTYISTGFTDATSEFIICDDRTLETGREVSVNSLGRPTTDNKYACP